jgi:DNA-binding MarR family transcriptional regulator
MTAEERAGTTAEVIRATAAVGEFYYASASAVGLTVQEARLLFILGLEPRNMLGLTSALKLPKSTMTGLIARMESAGLLVREPDDRDRRRLVATPTAAGREAAARFAHDLAGRVDAALSPLGAGQRAELASILTDVLQSAEPD